VLKGDKNSNTVGYGLLSMTFYIPL